MKKWLKWGLIAFVVWFIVDKPQAAANVVQDTLVALGGAADSFSTFVTDAIP